jgi:hypothetical protein
MVAQDGRDCYEYDSLKVETYWSVLGALTTEVEERLPDKPTLKSGVLFLYSLTMAEQNELR